MEDQLGALGLVLNCVVLWNTFYMNAALKQLRAQGLAVLDEDVARLSPFVRHHLNVHGKYSFLLPDLVGGLRALGDPAHLILMNLEGDLASPEGHDFRCSSTNGFWVQKSAVPSTLLR